MVQKNNRTILPVPLISSSKCRQHRVRPPPKPGIQNLANPSTRSILDLAACTQLQGIQDQVDLFFGGLEDMAGSILGPPAEFRPISSGECASSTSRVSVICQKLDRMWRLRTFHPIATRRTFWDSPNLWPSSRATLLSPVLTLHLSLHFVPPVFRP